MLEIFTKIYNLHIAASILLGLQDLSSSIYIKYSSLEWLHVVKQHSASSKGRGGGGSVQYYGSASGGPGDWCWCLATTLVACQRHMLCEKACLRNNRK